MTQGKVTSLGMTEIKWVIADLNQTASVKEQRVDGSSASDKGAVRCTLVAGKPVLGRKVSFLPLITSILGHSSCSPHRLHIACISMRKTFLPSTNLSKTLVSTPACLDLSQDLQMQVLLLYWILRK
jgi:hypothetical protein